jgi:hypothetical protein
MGPKPRDLPKPLHLEGMLSNLLNIKIITSKDKLKKLNKVLSQVSNSFR